MRVGNLLDQQTLRREAPQSIELDEDTAVNETETNLRRNKYRGRF